ncbi:LLM class F420-dependent oxidoreductase [Kutzneria buriramensis]|uniref:G6PDH family F420-dependent oxidoreductase n=1 Tax=Kutzneria buriramensis TaxID=1045776 RepID=A0A3E0HJ78_9PSEU|nr:LLM class F420-dependent oxidoreductase [Kutzneria buriramensis]REH46125.1 G6PDH family F420-dependent oxidoreductase [Kutzneria buriramensis]
MVRFGYTLMTEQAGPRELVRHAVAAEQAGFDFQVMSDHYSPWLAEQGHAPYAWSVLGAVAQATERTELMTYVTCPTIRYHPAVVAQKAATVQLLSEGRFTLGLGAGENLNEHITGGGWPPVNVRHEMLGEAVEIISRLFNGGQVDFVGRHYRVDSAKLWDLPAQRVPLALAVSGHQSVELFAPAADAMVAVDPDADLVAQWRRTAPDTDRFIGQIPVCFDRSEAAAVARAHEQFRWFGGGWKVNSELPGPAGFAGATQFVRPEDVAESIPCGPDVHRMVEAVAAYWKAGFTHIALVQIGGDRQEDFFDFARSELLPALRKASA